MPKEDAQRYAHDNNLSFVEVSALDSTNIESAFASLVNGNHRDLTNTLNRLDLLLYDVSFGFDFIVRHL